LARREAPPERSEGRDNIGDQYVRYYQWMKEQVHKIDYQIDAKWVRTKTRQYFNELSREQGTCGLLPVSSTSRRFQSSWLYEYYRKIDNERTELCDMEMVALGS